MNVLIAFGTTEGQTRKIARHLSAEMQKTGNVVETYDCSDHSNRPAVDAFDAVVLAGSVHDKRYQMELYEFIAANLAAIKAKPSAFVSVSLSVTLASGEAEAQQYVDDFIKETSWRPDRVHLAEGAIRYSEYDSNQIQTIDLIVFKSQKRLPPKTGNPEFTDWNALDVFANSFLEHIGSK